MPAQRGDDRIGVFAGHFYQRDKTRVAFHQRGDVAVLGTANQIALPMTRDGAVFDFRWPFPDRDRVDNLTTAVPTGTRMPRAAYTPLGSQVRNQLLLDRKSVV